MQRQGSQVFFPRREHDLEVSSYDNELRNIRFYTIFNVRHFLKKLLLPLCFLHRRKDV